MSTLFTITTILIAMDMVAMVASVLDEKSLIASKRLQVATLIALVAGEVGYAMVLVLYVCVFDGGGVLWIVVISVALVTNLNSIVSFVRNSKKHEVEQRLTELGQ